ncbi:UNKNOWN [Stylonychia lemnae]|uniref:Uncharacterized protein n=1 Tax=Stylonychia lemnae TaxID=5949 RepID=A0A078A6W3_STYLE|nr:UNKNOWN [Stylonychia lemnae]|eukprot:CDW77995.1 UNKNOWN [Stylonychia lemnae]
MKKQITRISFLIGLLGCSYVRGATIKSGQGFLQDQKNLAQTGAGCCVAEVLQFGGADSSVGELKQGSIQSNSAEVVVGVGSLEDTYHDHRCNDYHGKRYCDRTDECDASQGCGMRKKTIIIEGDIVYRDRIARVENGTANEWTEGCEEVSTNSKSSFATLEAPQACVEASVCPSE